MDKQHKSSLARQALQLLELVPARIWFFLVAALVLVLVVLWLLATCKAPVAEKENDGLIDITPQHVQSIRDIGQWEFLSVTDEELVDTMRRGVFFDDHLARIYYGTLRLGIDLGQVREGWLVAHGDTVEVTLPPIGLLDNHFIDEALTRSFHESGKWSAADREDLYRRAHQQMLRQALTPQNLLTARENGEMQVHKMLMAMGFNTITIHFLDE